VNSLFYENLLNHLNDAVICINSEFKIEWANKKSIILFGYNKDELINRSVEFLLNGIENIIKKKKIDFSNDYPNDLVELKALRNKGKQFLAEISFSYWNYDENLIYTLLVRDITDQRLEQEALIKAEALIEGRLEVENTRLLEEEKKLLVLREELRLASQIQQKLLPKSPPEIPGYDIAAINIPAKEVGGDYYDFITVSENEIIFCLGDVSGKGMPASLIMSNLQAALHTQALVGLSAKEAVGNANKIIYENTDSTKFVTFFYALLDFVDHRITFCNAGHDRPVYIRNKSIKKDLSTGGIPLGYLPDFEYEDEEIQFKNGSILVLYSDGITEPMNREEEEFGLERLITLINENIEKTSKELVKIILDKILEFTGDTEQMDDMTLMIIQRG